MLIKRYHKTILIMLGITSNIPISYIGVLKLAEIIALIYVITHFKSVIKITKKVKLIKQYTLFIVLWLILGTISSYLNDADTIGIYKGIANIFMIYITFWVFLLVLKNNISLISYYLIPFGLSSIFFNPFFYSLDLNTILTTITNVLSPGNIFYVDNYFDVFIVPILLPIIIASTILFYPKVNLSVAILLFFGLFAIFFDAKSVGFLFIFTSLTIFIRRYGIIQKSKNIKLILLISPLIIPILLFLAQNNFLGENSSQQIRDNIAKTTSFNPLLVIGRPEPTVAILAIIDQPLIGHGFNKYEPKYILQAKYLGLLPDDWNYTHEVTPAHSNLLIAMLEGGLFAGIFWIFILIISFRGFIKSYGLPFNKMTAYMFFAFFYLIWNVLFSATLRLDIGHFIAIIILLLSNYGSINYPKNKTVPITRLN